jgi:hypothetical protein
MSCYTLLANMIVRYIIVYQYSFNFNWLQVLRDNFIAYGKYDNDNEQISNENLDWKNKSSSKTAKLTQTKTKDQTIQYGCLE